MSNKKLSTTKKGFTIIEVVLVLAIAGLIFLMVFVALPALQRNQRDTQRKDDYATLQSLIISKYSENGTVPTGAAVTSLDDGIGKRDTDGHGRDPQNNVYDISAAGATGTINISSTPYSNATTAGRIVYIPSAECNSAGTPTRNSNTNTFVIYAYLESGTYCRSANFN